MHVDPERALRAWSVELAEHDGGHAVQLEQPRRDPAFPECLLQPLGIAANAGQVARHVGDCEQLREFGHDGGGVSLAMLSHAVEVLGRPRRDAGPENAEPDGEEHVSEHE